MITTRVAVLAFALVAGGMVPGVAQADYPPANPLLTCSLKTSGKTRLVVKVVVESGSPASSYRVRIERSAKKRGPWRTHAGPVTTKAGKAVKVKAKKGFYRARCSGGSSTGVSKVVKR